MPSVMLKQNLYRITRMLDKLTESTEIDSNKISYTYKFP